MVDIEGLNFFIVDIPLYSISLLKSITVDLSEKKHIVKYGMFKKIITFSITSMLFLIEMFLVDTLSLK